MQPRRLTLFSLLFSLCVVATGHAQSIRQLSNLPAGKWFASDELFGKPQQMGGKFYLNYRETNAEGPNIWCYDTTTGSTQKINLGTAPAGVDSQFIGAMNGKLFFKGERESLITISGAPYRIGQESIWSFHVSGGTWNQELPWSLDTSSFKMYDFRFIPDESRILFIGERSIIVSPGSPNPFIQISDVFMLNTSMGFVVSISDSLDLSARPSVAVVHKVIGDYVIYSGVQEDNSRLQVKELLYAYNRVSGVNKALLSTDIVFPGSFTTYFAWNDVNPATNLVLTDQLRSGDPTVYVRWYGSSLPFLTGQGTALWYVNLQTGTSQEITSPFSNVTPVANGSVGGKYYFVSDDLSPNPNFINYPFGVNQLVHGQTTYQRVGNLSGEAPFAVGKFSLQVTKNSPVLLAFGFPNASNELNVQKFDAGNSFASEQATFLAPASFRFTDNHVVFQNDRITIADGKVNGFVEYFAVDLQNRSSVQLTDFKLRANWHHGDLGVPIELNGKYYFVARSKTGTLPTSQTMAQLYAIDMPSVTTSLESPKNNSADSRWSIYPNPVESTSRIRFSLDAPREVSASLFTVDGREVVIQAPYRAEAGQHELQLPSFTGLGVIRMSFDGKMSSRKVVAR
jgi:hypothetical protein